MDNMIIDCFAGGGGASWSAQGTTPEVSCSKSDVVLAREEDKLKYRKRVE